MPGFLEHAAARVPLGRVGQPGDIAEVVGALFALGWVSGETVSADGGQHLNGPNQSQPV
jgi:3-oxoacyl-[acyl-carrier protein] reductase